MKILFSNLPWWENINGKLRQGIRAGSRWPFTKAAAHYPGEFRFGGYLPYPFFLGHAAGYTKKLLPESDVVVRDSVARGETYADFGLFLKDYNPDYIVVETATPSWEHDQMVIRKMIAPLGIQVILCGTLPETSHASILSEFPCVKAILRGEYDKNVTTAILGARGVYNHDLLTAQEMKDPPFPIWDEKCHGHYWDACPQGSFSPQLQLLTSRGCFFKCQFCVWPAVMTGNDPDGKGKRPVRFHSPQWVESYILDCLKKHPYKQIYFDDDSFNLSDKHVLEICEVMKRIKLPWSAMCRGDTIKQETWLAMKEAGCFGVKIGFESGNQWVVDHIVNKSLDIEKCAQTCKWLQSIGIRVHGTFTIGLVGETKEQQQDTINFIKRLRGDGSISTHQLSATAVVDGTPMSHIVKGERLEKYDGSVMSSDFVMVKDGQFGIENML